MTREPTEEQRSAIESESKSLAVLASAGAGKTFVLVERYLWLVTHKGLRPHQILTITFTRKAAAEMKARIVGRLRDLGLNDHAQEAETGPIQTIHSFCERILRENSLAAALDPDFEIMPESDRARLQEACISKAIGSIDSSDAEAMRLLHTLAGQREHGAASPYARLELSVASILRGLRGTRLRLADLEAISDPAELQRSLEGRILESCDDQVRFALASVPDTEGFAERLKAAHKIAGVKAKSFLTGKFDQETEATSIKQTSALVRIAKAVWAEMELAMTRRQCLDYALLESRAVALVTESGETRERISKQYLAMMVDEAQDVNPVQYQLLDALGVDDVMFVGDAQQSIYGFRQADVELFRGKAAGSDIVRLSKNWRSDEGILAFVDELFAGIWSETYQPMGVQAAWDPDTVELPNYPGIEIWEMQDRDISRTVDHLLEMVEENGLEKRNVTLLARNSRFANEVHQRLQALQIPSQIVGGSEKFYVRLEIRDLANILSALGNPYDDFALLSVLRSPVAGVSMDTVALLGSSKPVLGALSDFEPTNPKDQQILDEFKKWFLPLKEYADRLSAWEVISEVFAKSPLLPALAKRRRGTRMLANVRKLLTLAMQEPELGPIEFAEQIRDIQRLAHKEGDAPIEDQDIDAFTIMTIHKAKGLEFDVAVLADLHSRIGARANSVEVDGRLGLVATKFGRSDNVYHKWLAQKRKDHELEEELRVLYVAMTRAKKRLAIAAHTNPRNANALAGRVAKSMHLGSRTPLGVVVRGSSSSDSD